MSKALEVVRQSDYLVTIEQVVNGILAVLRGIGVRYTLVCLNGTGRSVNGAVFADREFELPVVAIYGGAHIVERDPRFETIIAQIMVGPSLGIILDYAEVYEVPRFYKALKTQAEFVVASYEEAMVRMGRGNKF